MKKRVEMKMRKGGWSQLLRCFDAKHPVTPTASACIPMMTMDESE